MIQDITSDQYEVLISKAKFISSSNYMDIAHDSIVNSLSFEDAIYRLKKTANDYKTCNLSDFTVFLSDDQVCRVCKELFPAMMFKRIIAGSRIYLSHSCLRCEYKKQREWAIKNREKVNNYSRVYHEKNKELINQKRRLKFQKNKDDMNRNKREWYLKNLERERKRTRENYRKNREVYNQRQRERRAEKKVNL